MKKTMLIGLGALLLVLLTGMGTVAYFSKSFSSNNNVATAAKFAVDVVNAEGITIGDANFNLGEVLYPGMDPQEVYSFQIKKNDTEVPVEYQVKLSGSGELFPANNNSPIVLTMQRQINDQWVNIDYASPFKLENDTDSFRIVVTWPHGVNDIAFQGKTGNIHLEVVATQVDPNVPGEINTSFVNTVKGEAASEGAKTIVSYRFDETGSTGDHFIFLINDGDGFASKPAQSGVLLYKDFFAPRYKVSELPNVIRTAIMTGTHRASYNDLKAKFDITAVGNEIIFTSKTNKAYDNFSIVIPPATGNQANIVGEFLAKQAGSVSSNGIKEVNTLTIDGAINDGGAFDITFSDGTETVTKTITATKKDTHATIAAVIASEFSSLSGWDVTNSNGSTNVVFTAKTASADKDVSITISK